MSRALRPIAIVSAIVCLVRVLAAQDPMITGNATYRERIALPPSAVLEITLEDVSRPGAVASVVARAEVSGPRRSPLPFALEYDPGGIEGGHRYAVRARIVDGDRVLFTTRQPAPVLTQGHGSTAELMLVVASFSHAVAESSAASVPTWPRLETFTFPATFVGTLPCADCPGVKHELTLLADDAFVLRKTRLGAKAVTPVHEIGSWVRSSDGRLIMLQTSTGTRAVFALVDGQTLRSVGGGETQGAVRSRDLRRSLGAAPIDLAMVLHGVYRVIDGHGQFAECSTGQRWPLADNGQMASLEATLSTNKARAGNGIFATIEGRVTPGAGAALLVTRLVSTDSVKRCAPRFVSLPLENTSWRLTELGATDVPQQAGRAGEIGLNFREQTGSFGGNGACQRLVGSYRTAADELTMRAGGTLRACPTATDTETRFREALNDTRSYRILGPSLELFSASGQSVAKFEAE